MQKPSSPSLPPTLAALLVAGVGAFALSGAGDRILPELALQSGAGSPFSGSGSLPLVNVLAAMIAAFASIDLARRHFGKEEALLGAILLAFLWPIAWFLPLSGGALLAAAGVSLLAWGLDAPKASGRSVAAAGLALTLIAQPSLWPLLPISLVAVLLHPEGNIRAGITVVLPALLLGGGLLLANQISLPALSFEASLLERLSAAIGSYERSPGIDLAYWREQNSSAGFGWALIAPLGLIGLLFRPSIARRRAWVLGGLTFALFLQPGGEAARLPLLLLLAGTAGVPAVRIGRALASRDWSGVLVPLLGTVVLVALLGIDRIGAEPAVDLVESRRQHVELLLEKGRPAEAAALAEPLLEELGPEDSELRRRMLRLLAQAEIDRREMNRADEWIRQLEALGEQENEDLLVRANWFFWMHRNKDAFPLYKRLSYRLPESYDAQLGLGWCLVEQASWKAARSQFQRALELRPEQASPIAGLGWCQLNGRENMDEAKRLAKRALDLPGEDSHAHELMAELARRDAVVPAMLEHLAECYKLDPHNRRVALTLTRMGAKLNEIRPEAP